MTTGSRDRGAKDTFFLQEVLGVAGDIAKQCLGGRTRGRDGIGVVGEKSKIVVRLRTVDEFQDEGVLRGVGSMINLDEWGRWHVWEAVKGLRGGLNMTEDAAIADS